MIRVGTRKSQVSARAAVEVCGRLLLAVLQGVGARRFVPCVRISGWALNSVGTGRVHSVERDPGLGSRWGAAYAQARRVSFLGEHSDPSGSSWSCEALSLGQWPGKGEANRHLCPQLARIQTDSVVATLKTLYPGLRFEISEFSKSSVGGDGK